MSSWDQLLQRQARERRKFLRHLASQDLSLNEGARVIGMSPTGFSNLLKKEGIERKNFSGVPFGQRKKRHGVHAYQECADRGLSKTETCAALGVTYNSVTEMERRHKSLTFRDGRTKR